jgi:predicted ribosome quality control (RQC) complex YloA/Tae2 family protein
MTEMLPGRPASTEASPASTGASPASTEASPASTGADTASRSAGSNAASPNWKEIDLLLREMNLAGGLIQDVHQPSHDRFVLSMFRAGEHSSVLACLSPRYPRLHLLTEKLPNPATPFRFASFLRAHIKGGRIESAEQVERERIVRIAVRRADELLTFWLRLWGSAANAVVTDADGTILDAFYRRPKRGEVSGGRFDPFPGAGARRGEASGALDGRVSSRRPEKEYGIRDLPGEGSFNAKVERHFRELESRGEAESSRARLEAELGVRESKVLANLEKLEKRLAEYQNLERFKQLGDLITSSLHLIARGDAWIKVEDFFHDNAQLDIELSPELSPAQNAEKYYERYRKARDGMGKVSDEIAHLHRMLAAIDRERRELADNPDVVLSAAADRKAARKTAVSPDLPGLVFDRPPYRFIVGRSAKENDELLRRAVRGNDWWFHSRDYPGAYVFVKAPQGKSLPLEVMLDAGNLAVHFSKGKASGAGDVYYTRVKYLRKVKGAKRGLVIPTQEKNIHVRLEETRLERLKGGSDAAEGPP